MIGNLIQKYVWLIQTFLRVGNRGLSLEDIQRMWERRWGENYPRRSFCNHRNQIEENFGIEILCRRSDNHYYINADGDSPEFDSSFKWILDSVTMNNISELRKGSLKGRIAFDESPSGKDRLLQIIRAMEDSLKLNIAYRKYSSKNSSRYTIYPYAIKENSQRWYMVGYCEEKKSLRVYALDRIVELEISDKGFRMPSGFNVDELFEDCYGIYLPDENAHTEKIVFRTTSTEARYLKDLPLHSSQMIEEENEDYVIFSIRVNPNRMLVMDFLSRGKNLEVLKPQHLREEIRNEINKLKDIYLYD